MITIINQIKKGNEWSAVYKADNSDKVISQIHICNGGVRNQKISLVVSRVYPNPGVIANANIQGLVFYARELGENGNNISVEFVDPGVAGNLTTSVSNSSITVTLASDGTTITSTISDVYNALINDSNVISLVDIIVPDNSVLSNTATAVTQTFLSGGESSNTILNYLLDYEITKGDFLTITAPLKLSKGEYLYIKSEIPTVSITLNVE